MRSQRLLARPTNPSAPTLFHAPLFPHAESYKPSKINPGRCGRVSSISSVTSALDRCDPSPTQLIWTLTPQIIRFTEAGLSDLVRQNDCQTLEFKGYGKNLITRSRGLSPDTPIQIAFRAAYFGLYGKLSQVRATECTYEPAMAKAFLHGRTEANWTVQPESIEFTKVRAFSEQKIEQKITTLRKACECHVGLSTAKASDKTGGSECHVVAQAKHGIYCVYRSQNERMTSLNARPRHTPPHVACLQLC
ncbi:Choline/Carnitine o-acyltransferase-domain-containing protein [Boletus edulis]|nr:Choline/Carnitine o-acyltransferase-domain-containing protein [Boletus edulis]